ncbi:MAG: hypothetical protein MOGMAGMI_00208 [Candidatus Omnitrophica bacterium]|nr:hypothetical protein [Candidatus Omnitrophota bacterium]
MSAKDYSMTTVEAGASARLRWGALILICAAALGLRLVAASQHVSTPYFKFTLVGLDGPDQNAYYEWAKAILRGSLVGEKLSSGQPLPFSPVYPAIVALGLRLDPSSVVWTLYLQGLLSAALVPVFFLYGRRLGGAIAGWTAAGLWAVYGPSVFYDACLLRDSMVTSSLFLLCYTLYRARITDAPPRSWVLIGLLAGAAFVLREHPVILIVPLMVWLAPRAASARTSPAARAGLLLTAALLAVAPFAVYNTRASGRLLPVSTQGVEAFWLGNTPGDPAAAHWPTARSRALQAESAQSFGGTARVFARELTRDPVGYARLYVRKAALFIKDYEIPGNYSYEVYRRIVPVSAWAPGRWSWVIGLALVGALAAWKRRAESYEVWVFCAVFLVAALLIHIQSRYRFILAPYLVLLAGCGISSLSELLKARRWRSYAVAFVLMMSVWAYSIVPPTMALYLDRLAPAGQERRPLPRLLESDYLTLLVSYYFTADRTYVPHLNQVAREAYTVYGDGIRQKFESSMRVLFQRKRNELMDRVYVSETIPNS